jgi:hypothetical protein
VAGYSGTPLRKKLGLRDDGEQLVAFLGAPASFGAALGPLPGGIRVQTSLTGKAPLDVVVLFATSRSALARAFPKAAARLEPAGGLWVAWPKRASGVPTDLTEDVAREIGLPAGLVDNKVCAIDETWSGLRFVIRRENRPEGRPRKG